jgi:hypothetical protein
MYGGLVRFVVKTGKRDKFLELLRWDARVAKDCEPGTLRLDVWEVEGEPDVVYVYEVYKPGSTDELIVSGDLVGVGRQMWPGIGCGWRRAGREGRA